MAVRVTRPDTVNEALLDRGVRHQLYLERYKTGEVRKILTFVNRTLYPAVVDRLVRRLAKIRSRGFDPGPVTTRRLRELEAELRDVISGPGREAFERVRDDLADLVKQEAAWQVGTIRGAVPVTIETTLPSARVLRSVVVSRPFNGRHLRGWFRGLEESVRRGVMDSVRVGIASGQTTDDIVRAIRGTASAGFRDGILEGTRHQIESVVRTAVQHVSTHARQETFRENADLIKGVQWVATLDTRTCFPSGTLVETERGPVPIESVTVGDRALTHRGRFRRVTEVMRRRYAGAMVSVEADGQQTAATADHLFASGGEWKPIWSIGVGEMITKSSEHSRGKLRPVDVRRPTLVDNEMNRGETSFPESGISIPFLGLVTMPVCAIDLKGDGVRNEEVYAKGTDLDLLASFNPKFTKSTPNVLLGSSFPVESSVATKGAEPFLAGRTASKAYAAIRASGKRRWPSAGFRTENSVISSSSKSRSTSLTVSVQGSAALGASRVSVSSTFGYGTTASAPHAFDSYPIGRMLEIAGARAELSRLVGFEALSARLADCSAMLDSVGVVAVSRAVERSTLSIEPTAASTARHFHDVIVTHMRFVRDELDVFNIEVEEDQSYVADGFVVHNCAECMALDGEVFPVDSGRRPPAHINCRCTPTPVLRSARDLGFDLADLPQGTRASMQGEVPESLTYGAWLRRQSAAMQDEALGPARGRAFRRGELDVKDFTDRRGRTFTLSELRKREPEAFSDAA